MKYKPLRKALKTIKDVEKKEVELRNVLTAFTSIEKDDERAPEVVAEKAVKEIESKMGEVRAQNILIYPFAHLSSSLGSPAVAQKVLNQMKELLEKKYKGGVHISPFGFYKEFELKCLGHPLAEAFKEITADSKVEKKKAKTKDRKDAVFKKAKIVAEELPENDHRRLGERLGLFSFHEVAPGMPFFHNNGMIILTQLVDFWRKEHRKAGYEEVQTPMILNRQLWEISGHWEHYKNNMYFTKIDEDDYAVKPMNCPGGIMIFKEKPRSYKELPLRMAELGLVHRHELSGVLSGLFRVRMFTQDDAHIFMREDQIKDEIIGVIKLTDKFYKTFGLDYHVELSTRPENSIGTEKQWKAAEAGLKEALESEKIKYKLNPGDGAFYGPKIDFHIKDALGRTWQCGTIQLDMAMPERFNLTYVGEDNKPHRVVMIHRVIYGALERFLGILTEHFRGNFPVWLAPEQVAVLTVTNKTDEYAKGVGKELEDAGLRAITNLSENTIDYKVREAQLRKIPYMLVVGEKEEKDKNVSVRRRDGKVEHGVELKVFVEQILDEITNKTIK